MKPTKTPTKPICTLGELVENQFDAMNRDLAHMTPRMIGAYNTIVGMVKLLPQKGGRK